MSGAARAYELGFPSLTVLVDSEADIRNVSARNTRNLRGRQVADLNGRRCRVSRTLKEQ